MEKNIIDNVIHVEFEFDDRGDNKICQYHFDPSFKYVGSKLGDAIIDTHRLFNRTGIDINQPNEHLKLVISRIFENSLKSYLALYDNLDYANSFENLHPQTWVDVVLNFSDAEISELLTKTWLNRPTNS